MPEYLAPGVYVEEVSGGARPISAIGTSTACFFGCAEGADSPLRTPVFVTNYAEFSRQFAQDLPEAPTPFTAAVDGFFRNGGTRLYVVNLGADAEKVTADDLDLIAAHEGISLVAAPGFTDPESHEAIMTDCEARRARFAVLDLPQTATAPDELTRGTADGGVRPRTTDRGIAAAYAPWIEVSNPGDRSRIAIGPSGHLCGLYAQTDAQRGVHKAPANASLRGVLGLTHRFSDGDQAVLNPAGINCLRIFPDGIRVWGARTLGPASGDYRYVPVRRLTLMIAESIRQGTRWVVFEPNDLTLWKAIRRDVGAFLHTLWRDGALAGATPDEAYFVKCDAETTTQADIDEGRVIAQVGIAPVKPAEFVIIRIGQSTSDSVTEEA